MRKFFKENWVEIVTVIAVLLGILVVLRRETIRIFINQQLPILRNDLVGLLNRIVEGFTRFFNKLTLVEMVVYALVIAGVLFIFFRIRYRFLRSQRWRSSVCPKCGGELYRVHRSVLDRFLSKTFLPHARRYLCKDSNCRWTGLKNIESARTGRRTDFNNFSFDSQE